jgi:HEAT repeat protein
VTVVLPFLFYLVPLLQVPLPRAPQAEAPAPPSDAQGLVDAILERKDSADPEWVRRLANLKTPEALEGLARFYDAVGSLYMRRIVVRSFALFDGEPATQPAALQKLTDIATLSIEAALRETALDELADCSGGRAYLTAIVDSAADDAIRERALRRHVAEGSPEDVEWYLRIFRAGEERKGDDKRDEKKKEEKQKDKRDKESDRKGDKNAGKAASSAAGEAPVYTRALQAIAFEGLVRSRSSDELAEAIGSPLVSVRKLALEQLAARADPQALEQAERLYSKGSERPDVRLMAAEILLHERGVKFAEELYMDCRRGVVPLELVFGAADLLIGIDDPGLRGQVIKGLGSGQENEKRFHLRIAAKIPDPKVDKGLLELSRDKERLVAADALRAMGERGNPTFIPRLEQVLRESKESLVLGAAIESLNRLQGEDKKWRAELANLITSADEVARNAAIEALGKTKDPAQLEALSQALAHPYWTTRLAAARALEELHLPAAVGVLCERIALEDGRVAIEFAETLWRLTGQPFRMDGKQWKRWWDAEGAQFRVLTPAELATREQERDLREAKQVSHARRSFRGVTVDSQFFGLEIESHHVGFVVDISLSMDWRLGGENATEGPFRMDIAKQELLACLDTLEAGTFFNIFPFGGGVTSWKKAPVQASEQSFAEAKEFIENLKTISGTNIHGGLKAAFADESIDTILFLSDGEPTQGEVLDPTGIREEVKAWNTERGVVIHTISIGDPFPLLQWLAEDSKGTYRTYP